MAKQATTRGFWVQATDEAPGSECVRRGLFWEEKRKGTGQAEKASTSSYLSLSLYTYIYTGTQFYRLLDVVGSLPFKERHPHQSNACSTACGIARLEAEYITISTHFQFGISGMHHFLEYINIEPICQDWFEGAPLPRGVLQVQCDFTGAPLLLYPKNG